MKFSEVRSDFETGYSVTKNTEVRAVLWLGLAFCRAIILAAEILAEAIRERKGE